MILRDYRVEDAEKVASGLVPEARIGDDQSGMVELMGIVHRKLGRMYTLEHGGEVAGSAGYFQHDGTVECFFFLTGRCESHGLETVRALRQGMGYARMLGKPMRALVNLRKEKAVRMMPLLGFRLAGTTRGGIGIFEANNG